MPVKKILIISYYWPPAGGAGVQRWLKFSKYLPEFGWKPVILTVDPEKGTYPQRDESLENEVGEGIEVHRTDSFEPLQIYAKLVGKDRVPYGGFSNEKSNSKLSRFLRGNFFIPDARRGWNRFAYERALKIIKDGSIDAVVTTGPPHSTHLIGLKLKKNEGIKWLADLRDPWTDIYYNEQMIRTEWAKRQDERYEKAVLHAADLCITASHGFAELFSEKVKREYHVITNGYDEGETDSVEGQKQNDRLVISYTGTMAESYDPGAFFRALKSLDNPFEVRIAGSVSDGIKRQVKESGLESSIAYLGYLPHDAALQEMKAADLLLLITPKVDNAKGIIPGKLFEYLSTGNPILAITENLNGDVAEILKETGAGRALSRDSVNEMIDFLQTKHSDYRTPKKYHRRELTRRFVEILES